MRRIKGQTGMSLVEALIILLVLMLLTGVLAPNIYEFIPDAQTVKVKEDCEAIGIEIMKLVRDVGPCLKINGAGKCELGNRADILYSRGAAVAPALSEGVVATPYGGTNMVTLNWGEVDLPKPNTDDLEHQLTTNAPGYPVLSSWAFDLTYPAMGLGWRGAYLPSPIGPDPWGMKYLVNTGFLAAATNASDTLGDGYKGWNADVFCISPGFNKIYETNFYMNANGGTTRVGDDFIFVISGASR